MFGKLTLFFLLHIRLDTYTTTRTWTIFWLIITWHITFLRTFTFLTWVAGLLILLKVLINISCTMHFYSFEFGESQNLLLLPFWSFRIKNMWRIDRMQSKAHAWFYCPKINIGISFLGILFILRKMRVKSLHIASITFQNLHLLVNFLPSL